MASKTDKLYLIIIRYRTVALIPAKDSYDAIIKYLVKTGFDSIRTYSCNRLMANIIEIKTISTGTDGKYYFVTASTKTIRGNHLSVDSYEITCYNDDIFKMINLKDIINNPMFMRPTIKEIRNCVGFSDAPEHELRKFCT